MPIVVMAKAPLTLRTSRKIYRLNAGDVLELSDLEAAELRSGRAEGMDALYVVEDTSVPQSPQPVTEVASPPPAPEPAETPPVATEPAPDKPSEEAEEGGNRQRPRRRSEGSA